jgi:uncharacterized membrane protein
VSLNALWRRQGVKIKSLNVAKLPSQAAPKGKAISPGSVAISALLILYPVLVYLGLSYSRISAVAILLIVVSIGRLFIKRSGMDTLGPATVLISAGGIVLAGAGLLRGSAEAMLYYPTLVNLVLLMVFVHSLFYPPAVITRLARIREPELPAAAVPYTRKVTVVWSVFFLLNGSASIFTAIWTTAETWTLYNGFIAYVLMAALFGGEWLVRARVMKEKAP